LADQVEENKVEVVLAKEVEMVNTLDPKNAGHEASNVSVEGDVGLDASEGVRVQTPSAAQKFKSAT